jgi:hypothetical protein
MPEVHDDDAFEGKVLPETAIHGGRSDNNKGGRLSGPKST